MAEVLGKKTQTLINLNYAKVKGKGQILVIENSILMPRDCVCPQMQILDFKWHHNQMSNKEK